MTGGLFLGDDATNATTQLTGHFPDSQDQRTVCGFRIRYQLISRLWCAASAEYGSGLPFEFTGTYEEALAQYGQAVVDRTNFDRGRVKPSLAVGASVGADVWKNDKVSMRLQADFLNLNNRLNGIDFGGLFPATRSHRLEVTLLVCRLPSSPAYRLLLLEKLYCAFVLLRRSQRRKRPKVPLLPSLGIFLSRVQAILTRFQFADHANKMHSTAARLAEKKRGTRYTTKYFAPG